MELSSIILFSSQNIDVQIIYGKYKASIGQILRLLCERKGVEIHEAEACPAYIHMLVSIPPKQIISSFMGYLKGKIA